MDTGERIQRIREWILKYRWAALILAVGLLLMTLPAGQQEQTQPIVAATVETVSLDEQLEELLSRLDGAGKVKVLLTQASGAESHYQTDVDTSQTADAADRRSETVILTDASRSQQALVRRVDPPTYLGAVVLCQGADRATVKLAVVEAVSTATGLTSDKITVLKLK